MKDDDRMLIIARLMQLNVYEADRLNEAIEAKKHWEGRVNEYGKDAGNKNLRNTYGELLDMSIKSTMHIKKRIEENERLIKALEGERWSD